MFFAGGRAVVVAANFGEGLFRELFGQLLRVGDGRRGTDELGRRAVKRADALEAAQDVGDVAAKNTPIGVDLVQDDVAQPLEEGHPARVVGKDAGMQHVGVADDNPGGLADGGAIALGCIAVVDGKGQRAQDRRGQLAGDGVELGELVLGEGLGGEEVEGAGAGLGEEPAEHGQVVAEGFAAGGGGDDDDVLAAQRSLGSKGLVSVEALDAAPAECRHQARVNARWGLGVARGPGRQVSPMGDALGELGIGLELMQDSRQGHGGIILQGPEWGKQGRDGAPNLARRPLPFALAWDRELPRV